MVTQFKDNPFEKDYYQWEKTIAQADYKRLYYIPALKSKLALCLNSRSEWRNPRSTRLTSALQLLNNEIKNELTLVGTDRFPDVDKLDSLR
jgi:hypothetical protein